MLRIAGKIPITIHPLFWVLAFLIGWIHSFSLAGTLVWVVIIILSVLCHEWGHALSARAFGQKVSIELQAMGGMTYRRGKKLSFGKEFLVVLCGPLAGVALAVVAWLAILSAPQLPPSFLSILSIVVRVNLFWSVVNMVPILPLDGGQLLRIILEKLFGVRGLRMTLFIGMSWAVVIGLYFITQYAYLAGSLFFLLAFEGFRSWRQSASMSAADQNEEVNTLFLQAQEHIQQGDLEKALDQLEVLRKKTKQGLIYTSSTLLMAKVLSDQGQYQQAYALAKPFEKRLPEEYLVFFHRLAFYNKDYDTVYTLANEAFQAYPHHETAFINALCCALLEKVRPSLGWLQCAIREGFDMTTEILKRQEFDAIRHDPQFTSFEKDLPL